MRVGVVLGVLFGLYVLGSTSGVFPSSEEVRDGAEKLGLWAYVFAIPAAIVLKAALLPSPIINGALGLIFGIPLGFTVALMASVGAACLEMFLGRRVLSARITDLLPAKARKYDKLLEERGYIAILYLRLLPLPHTLINYAAGMTSLQYRHLGLGTAIGGVPLTFAYVALGGSLDDLWSPVVAVAATLIVLFALLGLVLARREAA